MKHVIFANNEVQVRVAMETILENNGYTVCGLSYIDDVLNGALTTSVNINDLKAIIISSTLLIGEYKDKIKRIKNSFNYKSTPILIFSVERHSGDTDMIIAQDLSVEQRYTYITRYVA